MKMQQRIETASRILAHEARKAGRTDLDILGAELCAPENQGIAEIFSAIYDADTYRFLPWKRMLRAARSIR